MSSCADGTSAWRRLVLAATATAIALFFAHGSGSSGTARATPRRAQACHKPGSAPCCRSLLTQGGRVVRDAIRHRPADRITRATTAWLRQQPETARLSSATSARDRAQLRARCPAKLGATIRCRCVGAGGRPDLATLIGRHGPDAVIVGSLDPRSSPQPAGVRSPDLPARARGSCPVRPICRGTRPP